MLFLRIADNFLQGRAEIGSPQYVTGDLSLSTGCGVDRPVLNWRWRLGSDPLPCIQPGFHAVVLNSASPEEGDHNSFFGRSFSREHLGDHSP